jgi:RND family efflux transporter MFP subunit
MKRFLWITVGAILLASGIFWVARARSDSADAKSAYTYIKPQRRDLRQTVIVNGTITPVLSTEIRSEVSGRIARVLVEAGAEVEQNQPLIELDQSTLRVQIDEVRLGVTAARLRTERARLDYDRFKALADKKFATDKDLKEAEIAYQLAQNDTASQEARVRVLENSLSKSTIVAPYAGRILSLSARPGMIVTGADSGRDGATLIELADLKLLRVELLLNEIDTASLALGAEVEITFESVPEARATGRITFISPAAAKASGDGRTRDFPVRIGIEKSHPRVKPGMTARVNIPVAASANALSVEITAVFFDNKTDESYVFVRPGTPASAPPKTFVKIGVRDGQYVEITDGLKETDEVSTKRPSTPKSAGKSDGR